MAINSNFSIYEPEAWVDVYLANQYPSRPMVAQAVTNVAGADIEGLVAARNKQVNITRAVKTTTADVQDYSGNYTTASTPNASEESLVINKHKWIRFEIDKADQRFALPDLVEQHMVPRLHSLLDSINQDVKSEALGFEAAFADLNTTATVLDDADLREARRIMKSRKFSTEGMIAVISPEAEADLTGLDIFQLANQRGGTDVQLSGNMGRAFGFDFYVDNLGSSHSAASAGANVTANAAIGDTSLTVTGGSALAAGDVIYFGSANSTDDFYVVKSATATALELKEPLRKAVAGASANVAISGVGLSAAGGTNEFFYHPRALSLVTAVMESVDDSSRGVRRAAGFEPMNRVNYTMSIQETLSGATVLLEVLYGVKLFYPDLGLRYVKGATAKA